MNKIIITLIFVQLIGSVFVNANSNHAIIDSQKWEKIARGYDYTENYKTQQPRKKSNTHPIKNSEPFFSTDVTWVKYLIATIVLIGLSVLLIFLIISIYKESKEKFANNVPIQHIEDIENADLDYFLKQALNNGSFKEAIRIKYLILLKTLNMRRFVIWKKDKTNGNYVNEMFGKVGFDLFRMLTLNFERVWYGEKEVNEKDYLNLIPVFDQINSMITGETSIN